jgi:hypothetical protein
MTEEISIDDLAQDIAREVTPAIVAAIRTGIERGYALGTQNFLKQLSKLTSNLPLPPVAPVVKESPRAAHPDTERASLGSVKPAMLAMIGRREGASQREMEALGFKHNTVRGTLWTLRKDGIIAMRGDRWFMVPHEKQEAPTLSEGAS